MVTVGVLGGSNSTLSKALHQVNGVCVRQLNAEVFQPEELNGCDAFCILGGENPEPLTLEADLRQALEIQSGRGKRIFCEYVRSFGQSYCLPPVTSRFLRLAAVDTGAILDDQDNTYCPLFAHGTQARALLVYHEHASRHDRLRREEIAASDHEKWGLWLENPNIMMCSFRMCTPDLGCFAPWERWRHVILGIIDWVTGGALDVSACVDAISPSAVCVAQSSLPSREIPQVLDAAAQWVLSSGILREDGAKGVYEGFTSQVSPLGKRILASDIRADCCAEIGWFAFCQWLRTGDAAWRKRSDLLEAYCWDSFQIMEGDYAGMIRWSSVAWCVCYPDDAARVLLPTLFKAMYTNDHKYIERARMALRFLMSYTGTDGLISSRLDLPELSQQYQKECQSTPCGFHSAHYTAFYHAALLLGYRLTGDEQMYRVAEKGLTSIMEHYPNTIREQSQTQEMCRMVMPLSLLYWVSRKKQHRQWLYQVAEDLEHLRHKSGAILEWDEGYQAARSRQKNGECSILCENGDPVADLLYSVNWLPMGYLQAELVTQDADFHKKWSKTVEFLAKAQLISTDPRVNGAWARGYDVERMEVFANPYDTGWGPWAIESGWTVAQIGAGISLGLVRNRLQKIYTPV